MCARLCYDPAYSRMHSPTLTQNPLAAHLEAWMRGRVSALDFERFSGAQAELSLRSDPPISARCLLPKGAEVPAALADQPLSGACIYVGKGNEYHLATEIDVPGGGKVFTRHSLRNPITNDVCCFDAIQIASAGDAVREYFMRPILSIDEGEVMLHFREPGRFTVSTLDRLAATFLTSYPETRACLFQGDPEELARLRELTQTAG